MSGRTQGETNDSRPAKNAVTNVGVAFSNISLA
jgi:hypothetical protein